MDIELGNDHGGQVRTIVLNRPAKKNALTVAMYATMADELARAGASAEIRAVVLRGAGGVFTAGNDILDFVSEPSVSDDSHVVRFLKAIVAFPKPILASVDGAAIGVGTTMLLHCDFVAATASSRFQLPFVKLGLCPEGGSSLLVPRMAGLQRASELLLWGEPFDAATAREVGFVNEIAPDGAALAASIASRIERLLQLPPDAVAAAKELVRAPLRAELAETMKREALLFKERLGSAEAAEAFSAFMEKRTPRFGKSA